MKKLLKEAIENNIPIIKKEGIDFLKDFIVKNNIKTILELGTATGYSAINMALIDKDIKITSIERDKNRYNKAVNNVKRFNLDNQIKLINDDIFNVLINEQYDLVFIDAAKAQNINFFNLVKDYTNFIITDNLSFHGLVGKSDSIKSKNLRSLVTKIEKYIEFLKDNQEFETKFYEIGDYISVSIKTVN